MDIKHLEQTANLEILEQRKSIALDFKESVEMFRFLIQKAMWQFEKAEVEGNQDRMERMYPILESLRSNLTSIMSVGDLIEREVIEQAKRQTAKLEEEILKRAF